MLNKELIKNYHIENGKTIRKQHKKSNCFFDVVLPNEMSAANVADWDFNFQFDHIKSIEHGKIIDQKYLVWPVEKFGEVNKKIMYIQIENK